MASCGDNFPIVRIASFFITGICLASSCSSSIPNTLLWGIWGTLSISYISIVLLLPAQQFYRWQSYAGLIGLTTLLWAGFVCRMQDQNLVDADLATHIPHIEAYVAVALEPLPSDSTKKALTVGVQQVYAQHSWHNVSNTKVQLRLQNNFTSGIAYGDLYLVLGSPNHPSGPSNPHTFDYKAFLNRDGIAYQQYVAASAIQKIGHQPNNPLQNFLYRLRELCNHRLTQHLADLQVKAIVLALVLGIKNELDADLRDAYAGTGTMHILAVSGLHIGILYGILYFFLYWRRILIAKPWLRNLITCGIIWIYAGVTGLSASVLRAASMFTLISLARLAGKKSHIYNFLAASAILLLLYQPLLLESISFQLSYLAVWGIVYLQPKIKAWFQFKNYILQHLWMWTSVSLAAQIAVSPISTYYFHQLPVHFIIANWVVVPAAFGIFSLGVAILLTSPWDTVNIYLSTILEYLIMGMNKWVKLIHQLPFSTLHMYIAPWQVLLSYSILISGLIFLNTRTFKSFLLLSTLTLGLSIGSIRMAIKQHRQRSILFYGVAHHYAIALVDGMYGLLLVDKALYEDPKKRTYQLHPSFLARGIDNYKTYSFDDLMAMHHMSWQSYVDIKVGVWNGKTIIIMDHAIQNFAASGEKMAVDFLVIEKNSVKSLTQLLDRFEIQTLVIGASNDKRLAKQLENEAQDYQLQHHNLGTKGALEVVW